MKPLIMDVITVGDQRAIKTFIFGSLSYLLLCVLLRPLSLDMLLMYELVVNM